MSKELFKHIDGLQFGLKRPGAPSTRQGAESTTTNGCANTSED